FAPGGGEEPPAASACARTAATGTLRVQLGECDATVHDHLRALPVVFPHPLLRPREPPEQSLHAGVQSRLARAVLGRCQHRHRLPARRQPAAAGARSGRASTHGAPDPRPRRAAHRGSGRESTRVHRPPARRRSRIDVSRRGPGLGGAISRSLPHGAVRPRFRTRGAGSRRADRSGRGHRRRGGGAAARQSRLAAPPAPDASGADYADALRAAAGALSHPLRYPAEDQRTRDRRLRGTRGRTRASSARRFDPTRARESRASLLLSKPTGGRKDLHAQPWRFRDSVTATKGDSSPLAPGTGLARDELVSGHAGTSTSCEAARAQAPLAPGPPLVAIPAALRGLRRRPLSYLESLVHRYGDVVRLRFLVMDVLVVRQPDHV